MKINLGCGNDILPGYINVDINPSSDKVIKCDVEKDKLPFKDNFADQLYARDVLEHITNLIPFLNECFRVMKPGGVFIIEVPKFPSDKAVSDPTHVRFFVEETFQYLGEYEGSQKLYGIKPWILDDIQSTDNRIFARMKKCSTQ